MPSLKQITCQLEKDPSRTPLKEYSTNYGDGVVETFVAIPDDPTGFDIHLSSSGYVSSGLAMYVYIDGVYQCNRHRLGLMLPNGTITPEFYEVNFRVRQKEEKLGGGKFVARPWRFEKLNIATADAAPNVSDDVLGNLGTIEVVVLRCQQAASTEPANAEPATVTQDPRDSQTTKAPVKKTKKGVAIKRDMVLGIFDGAGDDSWPDNFGAGLDGPYDRYDHDRNYDHRHYDMGHSSHRSRRRRAPPGPPPGPPPRADFGPSYADYLRWISSHPDAAVEDGGRGRQRSTSYYEQYRPDDRGNSRDPRQRSGSRERSHRRRVRAEDGIPSGRPRSFWTFEDSNGCADPLEDLPHHHIPVRSRPDVMAQEPDTSNTSIEYEVTRRPRTSGNPTHSRFHSVIDSVSSPRTRDPPKVRHVHFADGYPDGNPFGNLARSDTADPVGQSLFNPSHSRRTSYRRNDPDASLLSSNSGSDPRYNPRYPPGPPQAPKPYTYMPNGQETHSRMPGGWEDPYDSAAIPNPFATRFVEPHNTEQDRHSNQSHRSSHHSGSNRSGSAKDQGGGWGTGPDTSGGQDSGWEVAANGDGDQALDGNTGGDTAGWGDYKDPEQGEKSAWGADGGDQKDKGDAENSCNANDTSNNAGEANWDNPAGNNDNGNTGWGNAAENNDTGNAGWNDTAGNNDTANDQNQGGWDTANQTNGAENTADQNTNGADDTTGQNTQWDNQEAQNENGADNKSNNGSFKWPDSASVQPAAAAWDTPAQPAATNKPESRKGGGSSKAGSKKASVSSGSFMHRPAVPAQPYVKGYWQNLRNQTPLGVTPPPVAAAAQQQDPDNATVIAASEAPYVVPEATAREAAVQHHVHAGKGHSYSHITGRPEYVDSLEAPYAIFRFKYRSREMLGKILGRRGREEMARDATEERKEERKRRLSELSKEELIEEMLKKSGGGSKAGSKAGGSKAGGAAKATTLEPFPEVKEVEKPQSVDKWVASVVAATTAKSSSDAQPTCDRCSAKLVGEWWHCDICEDYDVCCFCVSTQQRCNDESHELSKWKDNVDLGSGIKGDQPTGEKLPGVVKKSGGSQKSASVKGGNKQGGNKQGGNKQGGNKQGGNKQGGNKQGGNKQGWDSGNAADNSGSGGGGWDADNAANDSGANNAAGASGGGEGWGADNAAGTSGGGGDWGADNTTTANNDGAAGGNDAGGGAKTTWDNF